MPIIKMMMGCPGCGKTTYAKSHMGENDVYISRDEVRYSILQEGEAYFSREKEVYNKFINLINQALTISSVEYIWVDATHLNIASRAKLMRRLSTAIIDIIFLDLPFSVCAKRNSLRKGITQVPFHQLEKMYDSIESPTQVEGFRHIEIVKE